MSSKRNWIGMTLKFIIPLVISIGLCWLIFRDDSLEEMIRVALTKCDFSWMWAMLAINMLSFVFRAFRWGIQLEGVGIKAPFIDILYSIFGTYAVNLVFPRLGEVWRTGYIAHREDAPFGTVFGTMIADRFADLITGMLFTIATLVISYDEILAFVKQYPESYERILSTVTSPWLWLGSGAVVVAVILFFHYRRESVFVTKVRNFGNELWGGFAAIAKMKHKGRWLVWTLLLWGCYYFQLVVAFQAFPFTREIFDSHGLEAVLVCFTLTTIAMGIPSNGGIGPYQIAMIFGLSLYMPDGLGQEAAKAFEVDSKTFANVVLTLSTCLTIIVGLWTFVAIALSKKKARPRG